MTATPKVTDTSTLGLRPFFVKRKGDRYTIVSREGRGAITTNQAGVEAIRLLAEGQTVEHTKGVLGRRYGQPASAIDVAPLLETLFSSGLVRAVDGHDVRQRREGPPERPDIPGDNSSAAPAASAAPPASAARLWLALFVWGPLLGLALKHLPLRFALPLAYWWFARAPSPERERRIADNLRCAAGLNLTTGEMARIAARNAQAIHQQFCDRLLLASLPKRRLRRWLGAEVRVSGLEHLSSAIARGRGTILCSFHFGSYGLLPFVLAARGVPVTVYAGFGEDARTDVATWLTDRARRGADFPVRIVRGGMGLRTLTRCLELGETVLLYCDQAPRGAGRAPEARGLMSLPFLGTRIRAARGIGWLRCKTGATVLPAVLLWEGRHGHHLHIDPQVGGHAGSEESSGVDAVMAAVYGALERHVRENPAQWLRWEAFGALVAGPNRGAPASRANCT